MAFAETAQAVTENSTSPVLGYIVIFLAVAYFIYKKFGKKLIKKKSSGKSSSAANEQGQGKNKWYGNDRSLMSVTQFQKNARFVVFDLETTGLDPETDSIIEIGAVRVVNGKITDSFQKLINPKKHISEDATAVNHITDSMVKGCPTIKEVLPDFLDFVGNNILAAHNAGFDAAFLREACQKCGLTAPTKFFDTMRLNVYWPNLKNRKLETFLKAAGIQNDGSHRALSDAEATAKLIIASFDKIR